MQGGAKGRQGVAKALMTHVLGEMVKHGGQQVFLEVCDHNLPAKSLYNSFGYRNYGRRLEYNSEPRDDAILMRLDLLPKPGIGAQPE